MNISHAVSALEAIDACNRVNPDHIDIDNRVKMKRLLPGAVEEVQRAGLLQQFTQANLDAYRQPRSYWISSR